MAEWLERHLPDTARILVSPADRAQQTAQALPAAGSARCPSFAPVRIDRRRARGGELARRGEPVLVVGHQPTLGMVAARLLGGADAPWSVRKGSVWWLSNGRARPAPGSLLKR
jgi:phosphohistidine phosphatase